MKSKLVTMNFIEVVIVHCNKKIIIGYILLVSLKKSNLVALNFEFI